MAVIVRQLGNTISIRYNDVPIFARERALEVVRSIMLDHLNLGLQTVQGYIEDEVPVNTGALSQSFISEVTGSQIADMEGRVFSPLAYAIVIDQGRTPGARMPPIDAIELWVKRKGIAKASNSNFGALSELDQEDTLRSLAWAIAKKIQRDGIKPAYFMQAGWDRAAPKVEGVFEIMAEMIAIALVEDERSGGAAASGGKKPARSFGSRYL